MVGLVSSTSRLDQMNGLDFWGDDVSHVSARQALMREMQVMMHENDISDSCNGHNSRWRWAIGYRSRRGCFMANRAIGQ